MQKSEMVYFGVRGRQLGSADGDGDLLVRSQRDASDHTRDVIGAQSQLHSHGSSLVEAVSAEDLDIVGVGLGDGAQVGQNLTLPGTEAGLAHPARPGKLTVAAPVAPAPVPSALYLPAPPVDFGAENPSPNSACHFLTLLSKSVSS